jgi:DNA-directed RNA polymerase subunit RPC12/RpoP
VKFRCPRCKRVFAAAVGQAAVRCPGCGQELSTKPKLRRTCPECGAQYPVERIACPECGANHKVAGLQKEAGDTAPDADEPVPLAARGLLLVGGIGIAAVGVFLFAKGLEGGWILGFPVWLMLLGAAVALGGLAVPSAGAKARAARRRNCAIRQIRYRE